MPTNKQRREAARRHLERQLERRQQREAARKRMTLIASIAGTLVLIAAVVLVVVLAGGKEHSTAGGSGAPTSSGTSSPSPTPSPQVTTAVSTISKTTGACGYTSASTGNGGQIKNTGYPPDPKTTPTTARMVTFHTNRGVITMKLNSALAPCNAQSIAYLVGKGYYNNTSCHRLVTSGIYVLQCGDPTGTGAGEPSYTTKDENLSKAQYNAGVVAMANAGANTNGSQFFIVYKNIPAASLPKSYTEIGTITSGMNVVQQVAAGGEDDSNGSGDGKPKLGLTFETVTVAPPVTGSSTPISTKTTTVETITPSASAS